jgi:hypothetical protein
MKKTAKQSPRKAEQTDYCAWKAHAAALLERQGIAPGVMRERDWCQLYIRGATPEQAVEQVAATQGKRWRCIKRMGAATAVRERHRSEDLLGNKFGRTAQGKARRGAQRAFHFGLGYPVGPERWQGRPGA